MIVCVQVIARICRAGEHGTGVYIHYHGRTDRRNCVFVAVLFDKCRKRILNLFLKHGVKREYYRVAVNGLAGDFTRFCAVGRRGCCHYAVCSAKVILHGAFKAEFAYGVIHGICAQAERGFLLRSQILIRALRLVSVRSVLVFALVELAGDSYYMRCYRAVGVVARGSHVYINTPVKAAVFFDFGGERR